MGLRKAREVPHVPGWDPAMYDKLERRVRKLDNHMLLDFADIAGSAMARAFGDFRREGQELAALAEVRDGLETLWAVSEELRRRSTWT
jgi:hypothetical protein